MIIWLASYPKSGNTWVRIFLNSLFSQNNETNINEIKITQFPQRKNFDGLTNNIDDIEEIVKNSINSQVKVNLDNKVKIFKTHNAYWRLGKHFFTDTDNTLGCIYIVRDPRNIVTSIKNHFGKKDIDKAFEFLKNERKLIGTLDKPELEADLPTVISSWQNHYNSWKKLKTNYLLIKYENLLEKPESEFFKITDFLKKISNFEFKRENILESIKNSEFTKLRKQEEKNGFIEAQKDKGGTPIKFFNLGPENDWKKNSDKKITKKIETIFEKEMLELGYL
tara:strand:- start:95 stop:931 length:837 start_codon:yes stop_codon:yes gene_type:complete